jgi:hypothetical protein
VDIDCCSVYIYIAFRLKDSAPNVWTLTVVVSIFTLNIDTTTVNVHTIGALSFSLKVM